MKYNKLKAFTLAEVMVLLLTLSILMAAIAPVFTTRFSNYSADDVWTYVPGDDENDAYYDTPNKSSTAQAFIGMTPSGPGDISLYSADANSNTLYSKLVVRASDKIRISGVQYPQSQMQFRYGSSFGTYAGTLQGALFAGNGNMLVGGDYQNITNNAKGNTAYGKGALSNLKSGIGNTAVGVNALQKLEDAKYNTAVGVNAGSAIKSNAEGNTFVGVNIGYKATDSTSYSYNTVVGHDSAPSTLGKGNTFVGHKIATGSTTSAAQWNVALGNYALESLTSGYNNTAVGYGALANSSSGYNNTAIGINACTQVENDGSNKTCIGAYSGNSTTSYSNLFTGTAERVFIGSYPREYVSTDGNQKPAAVLEVHNVTSTSNKNMMPIPYVGDASVVINGNLIVRGESFFETTIRRPNSMNTIDQNLRKGLIAQRLHSITNGLYAFGGDDGFKRTQASVGSCHGCRQHAYNDMRINCICTAQAAGVPADTDYDKACTNCSASTSYDWSTASTDYSSRNGCQKYNFFGQYYHDNSLNRDVGLRYNPDNGYHESDAPLAHSKTSLSSSERNEGNKTSYYGYSCCPVLKSSDKRLKNVGGNFTAGLAELKKLNIYNYTFKADADKTPNVGVIAQDLKLVFPNAVTKTAEGYYQIRWDEMFYALINAVKDINSRVVKLASGINKDKERISNLKKDNAALNAQLDKLTEELTSLEAKK